MRGKSKIAVNNFSPKILESNFKQEIFEVKKVIPKFKNPFF
jgi:hypothetical protein